MRAGNIRLNHAFIEGNHRGGDTAMRIGSKPFYKLLLFALIALVLIMAVTITLNATRLHHAIQERTFSYVTDVTRQLTADIDNRIQKVMVDLSSLCDSLMHLDSPDALSDFLQRKTEMLGFTSIVYIGADGTVSKAASGIEEPLSLPGVQASLQGNTGVSFLNGEDILYTIPVILNEEVAGVLGGIRSKANMQELISTDCFSGTGLTCIIDSGGSVVISPTQVDPFLQLDSLFTSSPEGKTARSIRRMQEDMVSGQSGIFSFRSASGSDLILSYNPLSHFSWVLLTLVPSDVIASHVNGSMFWLYGIIGVVVVLMLLTLFALYASQRYHYRQMEEAAFTDRVTGGMTNAAFQLKCESLLPKAPANTYCIALMNIRNFKLINEHFGSEHGNDVLACIMHTLQKSMDGAEGFASRADADSFFLCLKSGTREEVARKMRQLTDSICAEVVKLRWYLGAPYSFSLQTGAYIVDNPSLEITIMQDRASMACRSRSSFEDGSCKFYDDSMLRRMRREEELNMLFESALEHHEFVVTLQPKVRLSDERIGGAEALVRWVHPQQGMIYPGEFIPLFEQNGRICRLDLYIFEEVCRTLHAWQQAGKPLFPVSVNLSRQHFSDPHFLDTYVEIATRYEIPRDMLELELTESIFFDDQGIENTKQQIKEMHRLGFRCSLDDFGSGYSSLGLLVEFDINVIKLDRRFFLDISNAKSRDVIASIVELAHRIGLSTVAEGIETQEQLDLLKGIGCDMVQGYIYSKPLSVAEFEVWFQSREQQAG